MSNFVNWNELRNTLFRPENYIQDASIVFVPTSAGAYGSDNIALFCRALPDSFLRLESKIEGNVTYRETKLVDRHVAESKETTTVIEEFVYSFLHDSKIDCLLPNLSPSKKLLHVAMDGFIQNLRLYWDQGTLLKQTGVLDFIHLSKAAAIESTIEQLPILGSKGSMRVLDPSKNMNLLAPLTAAQPDSSNSRQANGKSNGRATMADILSGSDTSADLPASASKPKPHRMSNVFNTNESNNAVSEMRNLSIQVNPNRLVSRVIISDQEEEQEQQKNQQQQQVKKSSIFDDSQGEPERPNISVNPKRFESNVFKEPEQTAPSASSLASYARRNGETTQAAEIRPSVLDSNRNKNSINIFSQDEEQQQYKPSVSLNPARNQQSFNIFGGEKEEEPKFVPSTGLSAKRLESHISGSGLSVSDNNQSGQPNYVTSANTRKPNNSNQSQFQFGYDENDNADEAKFKPRSTINHNASQIAFGEYDSPIKAIPSSRVLKPPGGVSTIEI